MKHMSSFINHNIFIILKNKLKKKNKTYYHYVYLQYLIHKLQHNLFLILKKKIIIYELHPAHDLIKLSTAILYSISNFFLFIKRNFFYSNQKDFFVLTNLLVFSH